MSLRTDVLLHVLGGGTIECYLWSDSAAPPVERAVRVLVRAHSQQRAEVAALLGEIKSRLSQFANDQALMHSATLGTYHRLLDGRVVMQLDVELESVDDRFDPPLYVRKLANRLRSWGIAPNLGAPWERE